MEIFLIQERKKERKYKVYDRFFVRRFSINKKKINGKEKKREKEKKKAHFLAVLAKKKKLLV